MSPKKGIYDSKSLFADNASLQLYSLCFKQKLKQYFSNKSKTFTS